MTDANLTFIGAGNMARSLIGGLLADGWAPERIRAADPDTDRLSELGLLNEITLSRDNGAAIAGADVVILAVKPQVMCEVARSLAADVQRHRPLIVSIAAGIRTKDLARWLDGYTALVRCMPNTPALLKCGATALYAGNDVADEQRGLAETILRAVGLTLWVENEDAMDAVTALSGSGPAYFFLLMEALQSAGERLKLPAEAARLLALQTAFGAAKMALESSENAAALRMRITSPGGTTEAALKTLEGGGLRELIYQALRSARERSKQLAEQFGAD